MTATSLKTAALFAAVASLGMGGSARVVPRTATYDIGPNVGYTRTRTRSGNNRGGFSFAAKKHRRKIARASRRYNLRTCAF